jgi:hypothetical protein
MNILTDSQLKSHPPRVGSNRTIDDYTLWQWLWLAYANKDLFESSMIEYWSGMGKNRFSEIVSLPTFDADIRSFCIELMDFIETHDTTMLPYAERKSIDYAKTYYERHCWVPEIKEPE